MPYSRQLAAIMFTDIQGYTALMQKNEEKAIQSREKHRSIFNSTTKKFNGHILQYYGDGTLSIFNSAIDAVNCAIEMQLGFQEEPTIPVRIGIHTGDIIFSEDDIIGDGVNVASRIESLSVPGSVFISDKVYDEVKNQESIRTSMLKTFKLKNVDNPIQVYAISNAGLVVPELDDIRGKVDTASAELHDKSIAVLAFENMSGDPEQEYFSDGISEEILNSLVTVAGLKVAGRTSAFSFKGKNEDIRKIGKKLNVAMVLEGSVRKAGKKVRVTAQLINVKDGYHLWSETYDRELEDIFAVQEDIANHIVEKLRLHVQDNFMSESRTQNIEAYEFFLKGSYFLTKDFMGTEKAMEYFQKAVELDPDYATAYARIGETYIIYGGYGIMPHAEAYINARKYAQKAIRIHEQEPLAHKVLSYVSLIFDWDWELAILAYNNAIQYGLPDPDEAITYYDVFIHKDFDHAIRVSEQLLEKDPLAIHPHWHLGIMNYFAGRYEEALINFNNTLELDPNYSEGHHWKGVVLGYLGRFDQAIASLESALEITQGIGPANFDMMVVKIQMGNKKDVLRVLDEWEQTGGHPDPSEPARLYALLGMHDEAISWLEKCYQYRSFWLPSLKFYRVWDLIRDDPRFIEIYNRMNFPE